MILAFDLGGTRLKAGAVSEDDGSVVSFHAVDVAGELDRGLAALTDTGRAVIEQTKCSGVGLCVPGLVDERGIVVSLPGKFDGIEGFDLPGYLRTEFGLSAVIANDAVAYGIGEAVFGAGRSFRRVVVVTIGTGVGVTVVDDGAPQSLGVFGAGILGGQIPIGERTAGPVDTSGRPDTIEAYCRAERVTDYAGEAGGSFASVSEVFKAHSRGDPRALAGIDIYRGHLVRALVALAHAHAPEAIVLGGGPMSLGTPLSAGIEEAVNSRLFGTYRVRITLSELGDSAALAGIARIHRGRAKP